MNILINNYKLTYKSVYRVHEREEELGVLKLFKEKGENVWKTINKERGVNKG